MNRNARRTYLTYFGLLLAVLLVVGYSARSVVFRPWTARSWSTAVSLANRIYLFGGRNAQNELVQDVLAVNPARKTLRRVGKLPNGLFGSAATALDGRIYVAGGTDKRFLSDRIERFNPETRAFTPVGVLPGKRAFGALVSSNGYLYYLGGWDGAKTSDEIVRIDPATGSGRVVGHLPEALEQFGAVTENGNTYLIGGQDGAGNFVNVMYAINPETGRVVAQGKLTTAAARMSATASHGAVYAVGGWNGTELHALLRIERTGDRLTPKVIMQIHYPVLDAALAAVGGQLYLIGGREQRYRRQVQVLRISLQRREVESMLLKSYAWW